MRVPAIEAVLMMGSRKNAAARHNPDRSRCQRITPLGKRFQLRNALAIDENIIAVARDLIARDTIGNLGERRWLSAENLSLLHHDQGEKRHNPLALRKPATLTRNAQFGSEFLLD